MGELAWAQSVTHPTNPKIHLSTAFQVLDGFGDKCSLSRDGSVIAVEAEWTPTDAAGKEGDAVSAVFIARRLSPAGATVPYYATPQVHSVRWNGGRQQ